MRLAPHSVCCSLIIVLLAISLLVPLATSVEAGSRRTRSRVSVATERRAPRCGRCSAIGLAGVLTVGIGMGVARVYAPEVAGAALSWISGRPAAVESVEWLGGSRVHLGGVKFPPYKGLGFSGSAQVRFDLSDLLSGAGFGDLQAKGRYFLEGHDVFLDVDQLTRKGMPGWWAGSQPFGSGNESGTLNLFGKAEADVSLEYSYDPQGRQHAVLVVGPTRCRVTRVPSEDRAPGQIEATCRPGGEAGAKDLGHIVQGFGFALPDSVLTMASDIKIEQLDMKANNMSNWNSLPSRLELHLRGSNARPFEVAVVSQHKMLEFVAERGDSYVRWKGKEGGFDRGHIEAKLAGSDLGVKEAQDIVFSGKVSGVDEDGALRLADATITAGATKLSVKALTIFDFSETISGLAGDASMAGLVRAKLVDVSGQFNGTTVNFEEARLEDGQLTGLGVVHFGPHRTAAHLLIDIDDKRLEIQNDAASCVVGSAADAAREEGDVASALEKKWAWEGTCTVKGLTLAKLRETIGAVRQAKLNHLTVDNGTFEFGGRAARLRWARAAMTGTYDSPFTLEAVAAADGSGPTLGGDLKLVRFSAGYGGAELTGVGPKLDLSVPARDVFASGTFVDSRQSKLTKITGRIGATKVTARTLAAAHGGNWETFALQLMAGSPFVEIDDLRFDLGGTQFALDVNGDPAKIAFEGMAGSAVRVDGELWPQERNGRTKPKDWSRLRGHGHVGAGRWNGEATVEGGQVDATVRALQMPAAELAKLLGLPEPPRDLKRVPEAEIAVKVPFDGKRGGTGRLYAKVPGLTVRATTKHPLDPLQSLKLSAEGDLGIPGLGWSLQTTLAAKPFGYSMGGVDARAKYDGTPIRLKGDATLQRGRGSAPWLLAGHFWSADPMMIEAFWEGDDAKSGSWGLAKAGRQRETRAESLQYDLDGLFRKLNVRPDLTVSGPLNYGSIGLHMDSHLRNDPKHGLVVQVDVAGAASGSVILEPSSNTISGKLRVNAVVPLSDLPLAKDGQFAKALMPEGKAYVKLRDLTLSGKTRMERRDSLAFHGNLLVRRPGERSPRIAAQVRKRAGKNLFVDDLKVYWPDKGCFVSSGSGEIDLHRGTIELTLKMAKGEGVLRDLLREKKVRVEGSLHEPRPKSEFQPTDLLLILGNTLRTILTGALEQLFGASPCDMH